MQRAAGGPAQVLPNARLADLGSSLTTKGYQVFRAGPQLYAFKGLAGRLGPIGVHAALLLSLFGTAYSGFGGWKGSAMVPEGQEFLVAQAINPASALAPLPSGAGAVLHVNGFSIETRPDGSVAQFYSDLSLRELDSGREVLRKKISVNDPFRCARHVPAHMMCGVVCVLCTLCTFALVAGGQLAGLATPGKILLPTGVLKHRLHATLNPRHAQVGRRHNVPDRLEPRRHHAARAQLDSRPGRALLL